MTYNSVASTLQSNIQAALDDPNVVGAGNSVVEAVGQAGSSPYAFTVTFTGALGGGQNVPAM